MSFAIRTITISNVIKAVDLGHKAKQAYDEAIDATRRECTGATRVDVVNAFLPHVASAYGMSTYNLPSGKGKYAAQCTFADKEHANYEAARKSLSRIVNDVLAGDKRTEPSKATAIRVKSSERAAYTLFLEACGNDVARAKAVFKSLISQ